MDNPVQTFQEPPSPVEPPPLKLLIKLAAVMSAVEPLAKRGQVDSKKADGTPGPRYAYVRSSDVLEMIRPILAGQGVLLQQIPFPLKKNDKGWINGWFTFRFWDVDSGQSLTQRWYAEAQDNQDKGPQKLATSARKNFLVAFFLLGADDDEKDRPKKPKPDPNGGELVQKDSPEEQRRKRLVKTIRLSESLFPSQEDFDSWFDQQGFGDEVRNPDDLDLNGLGILYQYLQDLQHSRE